MYPVDPTARILLELINKQYVTKSDLSSSVRRKLESLFDIGALIEERSGAGWRIVVTNPEAISSFATSQYPGGLETLTNTTPSRSESVFLYRDAKRGKNTSGEPVLIRGFSNASLVSRKGELNVGSITEIAGVMSFILSDDQEWNYNGARVALVENIEPFLHFEERFEDFDAVIYYAGRMSERFLNWLSYQTFEMVLFCDYDPVGLQEYLRLKKRYVNQVSLFIPNNFRALLKHHGKAKLMRDSSAIISKLRQEKDEIVKNVLSILEDFGTGLEQEILWADNDIGNGYV